MAKKTDNKFEHIEDISPFDEALLDEFFSLIARTTLRLTAQLERGILHERVKARMERARAQGHRIGRSRNWIRKASEAVLEQLWSVSGSVRYCAVKLQVNTKPSVTPHWKDLSMPRKR